MKQRWRREKQSLKLNQYYYHNFTKHFTPDWWVIWWLLSNYLNCSSPILLFVFLGSILLTASPHAAVNLRGIPPGSSTTGSIPSSLPFLLAALFELAAWTTRTSAQSTLHYIAVWVRPRCDTAGLNKPGHHEEDGKHTCVCVCLTSGAGQGRFGAGQSQQSVLL